MDQNTAIETSDIDNCCNYNPNFSSPKPLVNSLNKVSSTVVHIDDSAYAVRVSDSDGSSVRTDDSTYAISNSDSTYGVRFSDSSSQNSLNSIGDKGSLSDSTYVRARHSKECDVTSIATLWSDSSSPSPPPPSHSHSYSPSPPLPSTPPHTPSRGDIPQHIPTIDDRLDSLVNKTHKNSDCNEERNKSLNSFSNTDNQPCGQGLGLVSTLMGPETGMYMYIYV